MGYFVSTRLAWATWILYLLKSYFSLGTPFLVLRLSLRALHVLGRWIPPSCIPSQPFHLFVFRPRVYPWLSGWPGKDPSPECSDSRHGLLYHLPVSQILGAGHMTQWLKELATLAEDPSYSNIAPVPREPRPFSGLYEHCIHMVHSHTNRQTSIYINIREKFNLFLNFYKVLYSRNYTSFLSHRNSKEGWRDVSVVRSTY